jgi:hypothetical protein
MPSHQPTETLPALSTGDLEQVSGGNIAAIGQQIGGLVDQFAGTGGKGAQLGGQIGGLIGSFFGGGGSGG